MICTGIASGIRETSLCSLQVVYPYENKVVWKRTFATFLPRSLTMQETDSGINSMSVYADRTPRLKSNEKHPWGRNNCRRECGFHPSVMRGDLEEGGVVMGRTLIIQSLQTTVPALIRCSTALMHHLFLSPMVSCVLEESGNWFIFFHLCLCATDCAPTSAFRYLCLISRRKRPSRYNLCAMKHISSSGFDDRVFRLHKILWAFGH